MGWLFISESGSLVDRTNYLSFRPNDKHSFTNTLQKTGSAEIPLVIKAGDSYLSNPQSFDGVQVMLWDQPPSGGVRVFAGTITQIEVKPIGRAGARLVTIHAASFDRCFDTLLIPPQAYFAEQAGDIFTALFNGVAAGVPVSLGTVNAAFFINSLTYNWDRLSAAFKLLATASSTIWGIDLTNLTAFLKPISTTPAPYTLESSQIKWDSIKWSQDNKDYRNRQIVRGSLEAFSDSSELFPKFTLPQSFALRNPAQTVTGAWLTSNTQNTASGTFSANPSVGDTITIAYPQTGSIYNWAPAAPYQVVQIIIDPNNHVQKCTVAGLSGNAQPSWNDSGGTTSDGPGSPNLSFLGGVVWQDLGVSGAGGLGGSVYTFVSVLNNAKWGQVLIGASAAATAQNFADAINCNPATQGTAFSRPTWENPLVNADTPSGATVTIRNKAAGAGYQASLLTSSSHFAWSGTRTAGGVTKPNTYQLQVAQNGSSNSANIYFTPGSSVVALASVPSNSAGQSIQIQYRRYGNDCVVCENTDQVTARAALEGGTGKYQQIIQDTSNTSNTSLLEECQAALEAYGVVPITFSFMTWRPGLAPGELLAIAIAAGYPTGFDALINGNYLILEISGEMTRTKPYMDQRSVPGGGHYLFTVTVINVAQIYTMLDFWLKLGGSGGGGTLVAGPPPQGNGLLPPLGPSNSVMPWKPYGEPYLWSRTGYSFFAQVGPANSAFGGLLNLLAPAAVAVSGAPPVNMLSASANTPVIDQYAAVAAHGGNTLPTGDFVAQVFGYDAGGSATAGSNLTSFAISAAASRVSIGVNWGAATVAYEVFVGADINTLAGLGQVSGTPATINIDSFADYPGTYGPPDPFAETVLLRAKQVVHGGRAIATVLSVTLTTVVIGIPSAAAANAFNGCNLIRVSKGGSFSAIGNSIIGPVTASDTGSPACTLTVGGGGTHLAAGDLVLISTHSDTNTATSIGDSGFVSPFAPSGLAVNAETGEIVRILYDPTGAATGATATVLSNTNMVAATTPFALPDGTEVTPGAGCAFIFEAASWVTPSQTSLIRNSAMPTAGSHGTTYLASLDCSGLAGSVVLIQALIEDAQGDRSIETTDTLRMAYIPVAGVTYTTITPSGGNVTIDIANGFTDRVVLGATPLTLLAPVFTGGVILAGMTFTLYLDQDATGGRAVPAFTGGVGGFVSNTGAQVQMDGTASTRTALVFTFHGSYWSMDSQLTGIATS